MRNNEISMVKVVENKRLVRPTPATKDADYELMKRNHANLLSNNPHLKSVVTRLLDGF